MGRVKLSLFVAAGLAVALLLAFVVSPQASSQPDGLEKVAIDQGFVEEADGHRLADGPLADYGVQGVDDERMSTGLAGVIGVAVTFAFGFGLFALARRGRQTRSASDASTPSPTDAST
jgi:hypothetical protein